MAKVDLPTQLRDLEAVAKKKRQWIEEYEALVDLAGQLLTTPDSSAVTLPKVGKKRVTKTKNGSDRKRRKAHMRRPRSESMNDVLKLLRDKGEVVPVRDALQFGGKNSKKWDYYRSSLAREAAVLAAEGKLEAVKLKVPGFRNTVSGYRVREGVTV